MMIEAACDRNPKQPDWEGLDILVVAPMNATCQRDKAVVLKQGRLLREERAAEPKRSGNKDKKTEE